MSLDARPGGSGTWVVILLLVGIAVLALAPQGPIHLASRLADTDGTGVPAPAPAAIAPAAAGSGSSAVTVAATGEFAGLKVTVAQTKDLIDQTVQLSWTGGKPTNNTSAFDLDYLQVMQCWGDAATGPERTQCQFGGNVAFDSRGGQNSASRQLNQATYKDAKDPLLAKAAAGADVFVPFVSVTGVAVTGRDVLKNQFYDNTTTNEITYARTRGDGTGATLFETMTYREAPGLGCGQLLTSGSRSGQPRSCWLVIVPRGELEVDASNRAKVLAGPSGRLDSSPLSTTNWTNRLVVPLAFVAVGAACPISAVQKETGGVESATEVILRWQPALCRNNGPVFGYAQTPDATAERTLLTDDPGLVFVNKLPPSPPSDRLYAYAPVALSGLAIALDLERKTPATGTAAERARDGEPMTDLNLTPRLVAKLLTQSYRSSAPGAGTAQYLQKNVDNLTKDPDFQAINPGFKGTDFPTALEVLTPIGLSSSTTLLWQWIAADQDAADFLAGLPDPWGMRVNPFYQGATLPRPDFPKVDPYCTPAKPSIPPLCTLDEHPYAQDMHDAARSAARGDVLSRNFWDANAKPPAWKKVALQLSGQRQILALTDTATAARYGMAVAKLRNSSGAFVAPTTAALLSSLAAMTKTSVPGVLVADPATTNAAAYPLPLMTYAVTAPNILNPTDAKSFAGLVRYAVGTGQTPGVAPGTLPAGYAPLPAALRTVALAAATQIQARKGPKVSASTASKTPTRTTPARPGTTTGTGTTAVPTGLPSGLPTALPSGLSTGLATGPSAPVSGAAGQSGAQLPGTDPTPALAGASNPTAPDATAGRSRYALAAALLLGITASFLGPLLPRLARRLRQ